MNFLPKFACLTAALAAAMSLLTAQARRIAAQQPQGQTFNPMRAVHDVEVGKFYMKRGDLAGAIARFKDAILYKPHYAEACLLLGEAYEKQNDAATAVSYYQKYLTILPNLPESKKVRARIASLQKQIAKDKSASVQRGISESPQWRVRRNVSKT